MESGDENEFEEWSYEELSDTEDEITIILLKPCMIKVDPEELFLGGRHAEIAKNLKEIKKED